ncbi:MAG: hypothetical protein WC471_06150 [Candidatus Woesearchaeota archaeon]
MYKNKEKKLLTSKSWREKNKQTIRKQAKEWRENNPLSRLISSTKQTAKLKGLEHSITSNDLDTPKYCPYLGVRIDYSLGKGYNDFSPSIDRIDSTKGYIQGNVEVVSRLANTLKNKATTEQLVTFSRNILKRYEKENE